MKNILERLKLVDHLTTELEIEKRNFVEKLMLNIDQGDTSMFLSLFDIFDSSSNEYKGIVKYDSFKIRRRRRMFGMNNSLIVAEGTFKQKDNLVVVETEISANHGVLIPGIVFLLIVYIFAIASVFLTETQHGFKWAVIPLLLFHAVFMLGIPYFVMRRGVSRMKYDLERDLFYMTRKTLAST